MKRRLLCLLVALMLLAPVLAQADSAYETYDDPAGMFSFIYPDTWMLLTREITNEMLSAITASGLTDTPLQSVLENLKTQIDQLDMIMLLADDFSTNINIVTQKMDVEISGEDLLELIPHIISELETTLPAVNFSVEPFLLDLKGHPSLGLSYVVPTATAQYATAQVYASIGTNLYVCTLTCDNDLFPQYAKDFGLVLGTMLR